MFHTLRRLCPSSSRQNTGLGSGQEVPVELFIDKVPDYRHRAFFGKGGRGEGEIVLIFHLSVYPLEPTSVINPS